MKTQTDKVKAEAREVSRTADGQIHWLITATLQPGVANGYFKDEITLITNDTPGPDDPDLGRRQRPERRLGHPVDHQPRTGPPRPDDHQGQRRPRPIARRLSP